MAQGYWNTSASRLWTKIRDNFHDELVAMYAKMRANGLSYDTLMSYFYGQQISKIPETYYNKDADTKYLPFADQYMGMAHGNGYEHLKRWLKNRLIFTDTLYDYAPSYNNDVLTIRANTTEPMTITIETYTPVYQHLSWYNNQMDKKKIDGKTAITFTGTAQTATDQEVLIYGGSNIKRITGISSMNPNSMLIGSATRLIELDVSNCPILATVNATGSNFTPHTYLNKLDISNCPKLTGTLRINNSPLLRELNAKGTGIDTLQLAPSLRNLEVLRLPNTVTELTLNDAGLLNTLEFDEGANLQRISLSNCPGITNSSVDLTKVPSVSLDNSLDKEEIYLSEVTNLTLKNMPTLKRLLFTPNNEYEGFDINNVINGKNYKVTTFNNPNMKEFITTADNRLSNVHRSKATRTMSYIEGDGTAYLNTKYTPKSNTRIVLDAQMEYTKMYAHWLGCERKNKIQWDGSGSLMSGNSWTITPNTNLTTRQTYTITASQSINEMLVFCGYNNSNVLEDNYIGKGKIYSMKIYEGDTLVHDYVPAMNGDIATLYDNIDNTYLEVVGTLSPSYETIYPDITPNTVFSANTLDLSSTQFTDIKFLCTTDLYNLKVPTTMKNFYCDSAMDIDTEVITDGSYEVVHDELVEPYTTNYAGNVYRKRAELIYLKYQGNVGETLTDGKKIDSTKTIVDDGEYATSTDLIHIQDTVNSITFYSDGESWIRMLQYNENQEATIFTSNTNVTGNLTISLDSTTKYIRVCYRKATASASNLWIEAPTVYTPNIIPSSASGSLIFNLYSNNTTQPTSTSPYMWDLTGLKLNDFYTFGMNNWVKPSDDSYSIEGEDVLYLGVGNYQHSDGVIQNTYGFMLNLIKTPSSGILNISSDTAKEVELRVRYFDSDKNCIAYQNGLSMNIDNVLNNTESTYIGINIAQTDTSLINDYIDLTVNGIKYSCNTSLSVYEFKQYITDLDLYNKKLLTIQSITMPQRLPGYSIRMVNADITPNNYANHLYPLLVDTTLPITGKLDYSKYKGTSLAWAYAYTTNDVAITPLGSQQQGNITNDYNKLYGTDYVDIVDVWAYKDDDFSNKSTNEAITKAYIELTSSNYKTRIDEVLQWYPNCTDLYLFDDGSVTFLTDMLNRNNANTKWQIVKVEFIEGYFSGLNGMRYAFCGCTALTTVPNIPNSVTDMVETFRDCNSLTTAPNIPSGVTNMNGTFRGCSSLTTVPNIPSSVTNIDDTFNGCTSLTTAPNIPSGIFNMRSTFYGCSNLTTAPTIPNGVINLSNAFCNCSSLTTVPTIPDGVTNMDNCFNGCTSLTTASNIPSSVAGMYFTFRGCSSLTECTIPLTSLTNYANCLAGCTSLTNITWTGERTTDFSLTTLNAPSYTQADIQELVPEHLGTVESATLDLGGYGSSLEPADVFGANQKGWTIVGANMDFMIINKDFDVSSMVDDDSVTSCFIELTNSNKSSRIDSVLNHLPNCTSINLYEDGTVTTLSNLISRKTSSSKITEVSFVEGNFNNVTNMEYAFQDCTSLTKVNNIPKSVTSLECTFKGCSKLVTSPPIHDGVTNMYYTFWECISLVNAPDIPNTVTDIYGCFRSCWKLKTGPLTMPDEVETISYLFKDCRVLETVPTLPKRCVGGNMISPSAIETFLDCKKLTTVPPSMPDGIIDVTSCFQGATKLVNAPTFPDTVVIMKSAFMYDTSIQNVVVPPNVYNYWNVCFGCSALREVTLPLGALTSSSDTKFSDALYNCGNITNITWTGTLSVNYSLSTLCATSYTSQDVKELVNEHLGTVESATLTLGEAYLAYLTEEEIASAVSKGWTLQ